ncbi:endothelin-converting enzyme 1-like isoform X2 [Lineus longissimus]|uniref:endothelin-converting enzyme 1-like isoform X2 n=1 Tax=Lineus longissimus TaxID=88925 RepID=UPI00315C783D
MSKGPRIGLKVAFLLLFVVVVTLGIVVLVLSILLGERLMPKADKNPICLTSHCLRIASRLKRNMNESVKPCENFYDFSCGGYRQDADIPIELPDIIASIGYWRKEKARQLLELPIRRDITTSAERKLKDFYHSCLKDDLSDTERMAATRRLLSKLGGWRKPINRIDLGDWSPGGWDFYNSMLVAYRDLQISPFFRMYVEAENSNGTTRAYLTIEGLDPFECQPTTDRSRQFSRKLAEAFNPRDDPSTFVNGVTEVYDKVCKSTDEWRDPILTTITVKEFALRFPRSIPWTRLFKDIFKLDEDAIIRYNDADSDRLRNLDGIAGMNKRSLRDYMAIRFLVKYMSAMPKPLQDIFMDYSGGEWNKEERTWDACLELRHNKIFSLALLAELDRINKYPTTNDKKLHVIVKNVRRAVLERTGTLDWLPEDMRNDATRMVENKLVLMAGPPWILVERKLDEFYDKLTVFRNRTYLENIVNVNAFSGRMSVERLSRHSGLDYFIYTWNVEAIFASAESLLGTGAIGKGDVRMDEISPFQTWVRLHKAIFATLLQDPFYSHDSPGYLNYGGVGFVVGHEFGHDFEFRRMIAKRSRVEPLHSRLSCMKRAYRSVQYKGLKVLNKTVEEMSGQMTADISGLKWAYQAYLQNVAVHSPAEKRLPGLDYTQSQLFFINAVQGMCSRSYTKLRSKNLDFSVARVLGLVSQVSQIGDVFKCPYDSPLRSHNDCDIW